MKYHIYHSVTAVWQAVRAVFPAADIRGCVFHFAQAVLRKVGNLGLNPTYEKRAGVFLFVRKILGLPFLPPNDIQAAFDALHHNLTNQLLVQLVTYVEQTWMTSTVWPPQNWSVYRQAVRTNND